MSPNMVYPMIMVLVCLYACLLLVCLTCYVFYSIGLYTIAKRKQIPHAWMAWIPVLNGIVLGKASSMPDKKRNTHIVLPILEGVMWVSMALLIVMLFALMAYSMRGFALQSDSMMRGPMMRGYMMRGPMMHTGGFGMGPVVALLAADFLMLGVAIAYCIVFYMALYRIYKQFAPEFATFFTVMSVVFNITYPFFLFAVRNKPFAVEGISNCGGGSDVPALEARAQLESGETQP